MVTKPQFLGEARSRIEPFDDDDDDDELKIVVE
jgi:hypothetical protein